MISLNKRSNKLVAGALLVLALILTGTSSSAFADEENLVNPQQLPDSSFIYDTTIIDLSTADAYYNNQTVQVVGEVIGDNIIADSAGEYRWITLLSQDAEANATITLYISSENAEKIDTFGKYGSTGTMLRVRGTYHLTCPEHEGLSDIHVDYASVVTRGQQNPDEFVLDDFIPGIVTILLGVISLFIFYRIREGRR